MADEKQVSRLKKDLEASQNEAKELRGHVEEVKVGLEGDLELAKADLKTANEERDHETAKALAADEVARDVEAKWRDAQKKLEDKTTESEKWESAYRETFRDNEELRKAAENASVFECQECGDLVEVTGVKCDKCVAQAAESEGEEDHPAMA